MTPKVKIEMLPENVARLTIETSSKNGDGRDILAERKMPTADAQEARAALQEAVKGAQWHTHEPNARALRREMAQRIMLETL